MSLRQISGAATILLGLLTVAVPAKAAAPTVEISSVYYSPDASNGVHYFPDVQQNAWSQDGAIISMPLALGKYVHSVKTTGSSPSSSCLEQVKSQKWYCHMHGPIAIHYNWIGMYDALGSASHLGGTVTIQNDGPAGTASATVQMRPRADLRVSGRYLGDVGLTVDLWNRGPAWTRTVSFTVSGYASHASGALDSRCAWSGLAIKCTFPTIEKDDRLNLKFPLADDWQHTCLKLSAKNADYDPTPGDRTVTIPGPKGCSASPGGGGTTASHAPTVPRTSPSASAAASPTGSPASVESIDVTQSPESMPSLESTASSPNSTAPFWVYLLPVVLLVAIAGGLWWRRRASSALGDHPE